MPPAWKLSTLCWFPGYLAYDPRPSTPRRCGVIRRDLPAELMTEILLGATQAVVNPARLNELGLSLQRGFSAVIAVMLEGALTEKGRRKP